MAVGATGSSKTWPQSAKPRLEVRMMEPLSLARADPPAEPAARSAPPDRHHPDDQELALEEDAELAHACPSYDARFSSTAIVFRAACALVHFRLLPTHTYGRRPPNEQPVKVGSGELPLKGQETPKSRPPSRPPNWGSIAFEATSNCSCVPRSDWSRSTRYANLFSESHRAHDFTRRDVDHHCQPARGHHTRSARADHPVLTRVTDRETGAGASLQMPAWPLGGLQCRLAGGLRRPPRPASRRATSRSRCRRAASGPPQRAAPP